MAQEILKVSFYIADCGKLINQLQLITLSEDKSI